MNPLNEENLRYLLNTPYLDVNLKCKNGWSVLHSAAQNQLSHAEWCLLLDKGADIHWSLINSNTVLDEVIYRYNKTVEMNLIVIELIQRGSDIAKIRNKAILMIVV